MDDLSFDSLARTLRAGLTRRNVLAILASVPLGSGPGMLPLADAAAKRKKPNRCLKELAVCAPDSGRACCSGAGLCCPPWLAAGETEPSCAPGGATCCDPEIEGGGWCSEGEQCCPVSPRFRLGWCESLEGDCCTDEWWGSCPAGTHCCNDPEPASCCPNAPERSSPAARGRIRRNYIRRQGRQPRG